MSIKPPYKMESYGGGFASSMCGSCQESIGAGTRYKELRCSRCGAASYCSPECQRKVWPTHKIECKASVKRQQRLDELTLRDPHKAALEVALNLYGYDILGEIIQIPMRTLLRLGHPDQCCHSHLLRLHFDYNSSGETERLSFIFTEAEVVSFEEEEKRLEGVEDPTVYIPTLEEREERKPSATATSVRASVDLVARDVKLGFETNVSLRTVDVLISAIPFLPLSEWKLNPRWEECFRQSIREPDGPDTMTAAMFDLLFSQGDKEGMRILERDLGDDPFWADMLYIWKNKAAPPRRKERLSKCLEFIDAEPADKPLDMRKVWLAARRAVPWT